MRRVLILLVALLALIVAGCGGGSDSGSGTSKEQYGKEIQQAGQTLQKTFADISDQTGSATSSKQIGDRLDKGATALDDAAKKFGDITPPEEAKAAHQKLVDGLSELADVFRKGADAARKNDTASLTKELQGLTTSDGVKKITEAQQELKAAGINVGGSSGG
jgi:predicted small secreted protein